MNEYWANLVDKAREQKRKKKFRDIRIWGNSENLFNKKNCASKEKWIKAIKDKRVECL